MSKHNTTEIIIYEYKSKCFLRFRILPVLAKKPFYKSI